MKFQSASVEFERTFSGLVVKTLTLRALRICSAALLELEPDFIKSVFLENGYPLEVIQSSIRDVQLQQKK